MSHYFFTISRIENVKESFNNNQNIICENKEIRKAAQTIIINKKQDGVLKTILLSPRLTIGVFIW